MEDYFAAKAKLFDGRSERAVVVTDDDWGRRLAVDVQARHRQHQREAMPTGGPSTSPTGPTARPGFGCSDRTSTSRAVARFPVATTWPMRCWRWQYSPSRRRPGARCRAPGSRPPACPDGCSAIPGAPFLAVVDYSHKPAAVEGALRALRPLTAGKLIIVLGCGGDRDREKRPLMGAVAAEHADLLIVTDDNPRSRGSGRRSASAMLAARARRARSRRDRRDRRPARGDPRRRGRLLLPATPC